MKLHERLTRVSLSWNKNLPNLKLLNESFVKLYLTSCHIECLVSKWTADDVADWLKNVVHLPQYANVFIKKQINGRHLPRYSFIFS